MDALLEKMLGYLVSGGVVMVPLLAMGLLLWICLGLRTALLRRGTGESLDQAVDGVVRGVVGPAGYGVVAEALRRAAAALARGPEGADEEVDLTLRDLRGGLRRFRRAVTAMAGAAPLLGLLGTVMGMIETFASLTDRALFAQSGGVAGGISVALVSTQMGLLVAIPALLVGRLLDRREARLADELKRMHHMLHKKLHASATLATEGHGP